MFWPPFFQFIELKSKGGAVVTPPPPSGVELWRFPLRSKEAPKTHRSWIWNNFRPKSSFEHKKSLKLRNNSQYWQIFGFQNAKIGRKPAETWLEGPVYLEFWPKIFYVIKPKIGDFIPKLRPPTPQKKNTPFFLGGGGGRPYKMSYIWRIN